MMIFVVLVILYTLHIVYRRYSILNREREREREVLLWERKLGYTLADSHLSSLHSILLQNEGRSSVTDRLAFAETDQTLPSLAVSQLLLCDNALGGD